MKKSQLKNCPDCNGELEIIYIALGHCTPSNFRCKECNKFWSGGERQYLSNDGKKFKVMPLRPTCPERIKELKDGGWLDKDEE